MWGSINAGTTIGTKGSEGGRILKDEEHILGARISLEQGGFIPFSLTCGVYGLMVHTVFASSLAEAEALFATVQARLTAMMEETNAQSFDAEVKRFVEDF
jgi:hypothetical protein